MVRAVALSLAVLLAVFEIGTCLKCYDCSSASDPKNCGAKFSATDKFKECTLQDAGAVLKSIGLNLPNGPHPFCVKATESTANGIIRSCIFANNAGEVKNFCDASKSVLKSCEYCEKDYCNASTAITASLPVAFFALIASYLLYKQ